MTTGEILTIIGQLAKIGVPRIAFEGGEPLLRTDIFEVMQFARRSGLGVWLLTDGLLVDTKAIEFLQTNEINVQISLDGFKESTHDTIGVSMGRTNVQSAR